METVQATKMQPLARCLLRMQSDKRLVKLFRRGTDPAFDELVRRYRTSLVNFAAVIAGRDRADDVVQDSLVKAHRSLSRDQPDEFGAWLYRIVRNTALNDIRDNGRHCNAELGHSAGVVEQPHDVLLRANGWRQWWRRSRSSRTPSERRSSVVNSAALLTTRSRSSSTSRPARPSN